MADYITTHNDFFYTKDSSGLDAFIRLRKMRKLVSDAFVELQYVFPQNVAHGQVVQVLDRLMKDTLNVLDDVLQKNKTKKSRQQRA